MTELERRIRAELDRFCISDRCAEVGKAALLGVLDLHREVDDGTDDTGKRYHRCSCGYPYHPCPTLKAVARGLGLFGEAET